MEKLTTVTNIIKESINHILERKITEQTIKKYIENYPDSWKDRLKNDFSIITGEIIEEQIQMVIGKREPSPEDFKLLIESEVNEEEKDEQVVSPEMQKQKQLRHYKLEFQGHTMVQSEENEEESVPEYLEEIDTFEKDGAIYVVGVSQDENLEYAMVQKYSENGMFLRSWALFEDDYKNIFVDQQKKDPKKLPEFLEW